MLNNPNFVGKAPAEKVEAEKAKLLKYKETYEQVLERIEREDGGLTRDRVIDWDKEVSQYIAEELNINPELGSENYISENIKAEYLKEFLSKPMKDLMNEVQIGREKKTLSLEEAQVLYPNIVDLSEEFNNSAPTEDEVLEKLRSMVGEVYATSTEDKNIQIEGGRKKLSHIYKGDTYKNDFRKKRELNRKLTNNVEKLINNAEFIEAELPQQEKNKEYLLGMHNYEVPVFVNGHGFMVRLEGEVIKNASDYSQSHKTTKKTLTSEAQLDNTELLIKLQAAKVSNLYVIRKQRPLFKVEQNYEIQTDLQSSKIQKMVVGNNIAKDIVIEPYSRKPEDIEAMKLFVANVSGNDIENITNDHAQAFIDNLGTPEEAYLTAKSDGTFEYTNNNPYSLDIYKTSEPKEILPIIEDVANEHIIRFGASSEHVKDFIFIHSINEKIKDNEKIALLSNQLENANKTIQEQNQLLEGKGSVKVNGVERTFEHGLKHAFPEAVKQLDKQIQINKDLTRAYNNLAKSKSNDISPISPSDDGNTYS